MAHNTARPRQKAILVGLTLPGSKEAETRDSLEELARLVKTLGLDVVESLSQRRGSSSGATVLGDGKLRELAAMTGGKGYVKRTFARKTKAQLRREATEHDDEESDEAGHEFEEPARDEVRQLGALGRPMPSDNDDDEGSEVTEPFDEAFALFEESDDDDDAQEPDDADLPARLEVDVVVFDCELSPSQIANLQHALGVDVLDRTGVIVQIFSRHARTREARLQVEIARLKYLAPRIRHAGGGDDRMQLGGERSIELDRRRIRDRIAELRDELALLQTQQASNRLQRHSLPTVALVGYTNAGKSSMMRALTGSEVLVEDKLFATLDTTVRALVPPSVPPILVSDTVGFIKKLPHDLVASFRSTLEEAKNADLLLFVVDASDGSFRQQLAVTREVLDSLEVIETPSMLVLNKADRLSAEQGSALCAEFPGAVLMSAHDPKQVAQLRLAIIERFESHMVETEVFVPYTEQRIVGQVHERFRVLGERYDEQGTWLQIKADPQQLDVFCGQHPVLSSHSNLPAEEASPHGSRYR